MTSIVLKATAVGLIAAIAAAAAQMRITGEISPGVTGGVAGAFAASVTVMGQTRKTGD